MMSRRGVTGKILQAIFFGDAKMHKKLNRGCFLKIGEEAWEKKYF